VLEPFNVVTHRDGHKCVTTSVWEVRQRVERQSLKKQVTGQKLLVLLEVKIQIKIYKVEYESKTSRR
jgi:hypothetical protein